MHQGATQGQTQYQLRLDEGRWSSGAYFVEIVTATGQSERLRFVVE